jgi:catechol 2,3-dioxygenase-like lactoylglutathione lyase family enzyme
MKFDHVVISARDMEASVPWYDAVLSAIGFAKTRDHVWVNEHGQAVDVRPATVPEHVYVRGGAGVNHIAFAAPSREAVEATAGRLRQAGLQVPAIQHFDEARALFMKDPDGMRIEIAHEPG